MLLARRALALFAAGCLLGLIGAVPVRAEGRNAFVVGINAYPQLGQEAQLSRAVNDAQAVGDALAGLGFTVTRVTQGAELAPLLSEFGRFVLGVRPGDTVVFFYAGHGISLDDGTHLLPSDVPPLKPSDELLAKRVTISEREISEQLRGTGARAALVVLDACRNNPFPPKGTRAIGLSMRGLTRLSPADGVFTLYSAREGQTAIDSLGNDDSRNSIFTRVFVETLKKPGISISELGESVRDDVALLARSAGHDQVPAVYNDLIGARNLYLAGSSAAPKPDAAAPPPVAEPPAAKLAEAAAERRPDPPPAPRPEPSAELPEWCASPKPKSRVEHIICSDPALAGADTRLNRLYNERLAGLSGAARARFVQEGRAWIGARNARCGIGTVGSIRDCLLTAIEDRTGTIRPASLPAEASTGKDQPVSDMPDWCVSGSPKNPIERIICSDPRLAASDTRLNRLYNDRLAHLSGASRARFVEDGRAWLKERNVRCDTGSAGGTRDCLLVAIEIRTRELRP